MKKVHKLSDSELEPVRFLSYHFCEHQTSLSPANKERAGSAKG
jgi:hypothetical protein